ncbi:TlpA family protein disulfide reductase [Salmonirosea aquatica]|uniref:Thioredoxin domain-containing protein n=1 Tax=Salmonirosea aquatica TaxID=2654236 RepID=A0A7C9BID1_9BACT|nr:hypothetical protein [Cytophagaceae bacterium SJW1-29]
MKFLLSSLLALATLNTWAQNPAKITIKSAENTDYTYSLTLERPRFHETLGVGLSETEFEPVGTFDLSQQKEGTATVPISEPALVRLVRTPKNAATNTNPGGVRNESRTYLLYLIPNDDLTINVGNANELAFTGDHADRQVFLQNYFLDNHYQYLPAFSFNPRQIDNAAIVKQSDSLARLRTQQYEVFKAAHPADEAFDTFVNATTQVEGYLMQGIVKDREIRKNKAVKLTPEQRKELNAITLNNFKLFPDAALASAAYRNELKKWVMIPVTEKYSLEADPAALSPEAVAEVYQSSAEKLSGYPKQQEYLLTYWLNYASTALPSTQTARSLLTDFEKRYPGAAVNGYFSKLISAKEKLAQGSMAPDFTLLNKDSSAVSLSSLRGKPLAVAFAFNLKQHEPALKLLENAKGDSILFVYVSATPGIPFGTWKQYVEQRPNALHLYATDEQIEKLKESYAIEPRFPFMVIDSNGRIVNRWIPQDFPDNKALQAGLRQAK